MPGAIKAELDIDYVEGVLCESSCKRKSADGGVARRGSCT